MNFTFTVTGIEIKVRLHLYSSLSI
jgi:hypothetical protein